MNEGKMTLEEFQQILKDANISTEFESILSKLSGYMYKLSDDFVVNGCDAVSRDYIRKGNIIFNALDKRGYKDGKSDVLDKIRAEIEHLTITEGGDDYIRKMAELYSLKIKLLQIIEKYRGRDNKR